MNEMEMYSSQKATVDDSNSLSAQRTVLSVSSISTWDWFSLIVPLLAISPLLYSQCHILLRKEHLQFFPLAWGAAAYFFYKEGDINNGTSRLRGSIAFVATIGSIVLCYAALIIFSSWLAHLCLILLTWSWAMGRLGNLTPLRITGICGLLLITLPAPSGWDSRLVQMLQSLSSLLCSRLMDVFGIIHLRAGNIIEIPTKPLFVEEACSGVDSQYALMAVAGVWLLVGRSNLWVSLCTIVTVPIWAILGNLLRIFTIVIGLEFFNFDLSAGMPHTILGLLVFCVAAYAHWSSVQVFNYGNELVMNVSRNRKYSTNLDIECQRLSLQGMAPTVSRYWLFLLAPLCPLTVIAFSAVLFAAPLDYSLDINPSIAESFPGRRSLPTLVQGFEQSAYRDVLRNRGDLLGQYSRTWSFNARDGEALVASLDFPFRGWHPLWECYENAGWTRLETVRVDKDAQGNDMSWPFFKVTLSNREQGFGLLFFSLFDQFGRPYDFDGSFEYRREGSRLSRSILDIVKKLQTGDKTLQEPVTIQFQTLYTSEKPLDDQSILERQRMFLMLRDEVYRKSSSAIKSIR
jgi:exosortase